MSFLKFLIRLHRLKVDYQFPAEVRKCVLIMAPHTSMYDFIIGKIVLSDLGVKTVIAIKREFFFFPIGWFLQKLNCVPVDRLHAANFPKFAAELIKNSEEIAFLICPEGTRKKTNRWKRGFYKIAQEANVPICFGYLDYRTRHAGISGTLYPTGDYQKDFATIEHFYNGMRGFHKNHFNLEDNPHGHPEWL